MNKLSTDIFIERSIEIHNNKYDYSLVNYVDSHTKVRIICPNHGIFEQMPYHHINGSGCSICAKHKKGTNEDFIKKSIEIHNNKYDYSLVNYINQYVKIQIVCPIHGIFEQTPKNHLNKCGCPKCVGRNIEFDDLKDEFVNIHGNKYEYYKDSFIGKSFKMKIKCKLHDYIFYQYVDNHLKGWGCPKCSKRYNYTTDEYIKICDDVHNYKYDYSLTNYTKADNMIKIICLKHGIFKQKAKYHISGHGCPICNYSKGEFIISNFLNSMKIEFESQKRFAACKDKYTLPFDFYLPKYKMCIEYQGRQHFDDILGWGGYNSLELIKKHDKMKIYFCENNDISLLIINYYDDIMLILKNKFGLK